jgi:hypothetical protein
MRTKIGLKNKWNKILKEKIKKKLRKELKKNN